jgi:hypothetical protein
VLGQIEEIYHKYNGIPGYRTMRIYLERRGIYYSPTTIHKYMNIELSLRSIVRSHSYNDYRTPYQAWISYSAEAGACPEIGLVEGDLS